MDENAEEKEDKEDEIEIKNEISLAFGSYITEDELSK